MAVGGEGVDDVGPGTDEPTVDLRERIRMIEDHLGREGAGPELAAAFQFEQVALGAQDRAGLEVGLRHRSR